MAKVEVLCPNGHRVSVKVTPNTKILQILEETCTKQGFLPSSDYELKHGRRSLDVTLSVQFAALPNLAKLELVRLSKSRAESSVVIALQLVDGRRVQGEFMPSSTLWSILEHFDANSESGDKFTVSLLSTEHPVCIYMKDEIVSEYALREATLRSLGLTGGKAVIRHVFRAVSDETLAAVIHRVDTEKSRQSRLQSTAPAAETQVAPSATAMASTSDMHPAVDNTESSMSVATESLMSVTQTSPDDAMESDDQGCRVTDGWNADQFSSIFHQPAYHRQEEASSLPVESWSPAPFADFKFPEETKGQALYKNELSDVNKEEFRPCDRETVVYSMDESQPERLQDEEIPDEFFEVTESDIRRMWQDLQRQTNEMMEQPLLTQTSRTQRLESKMSRYKRVVIRVQFSDGLVIQGLFRTTETVFALYKFIKDHLSDHDIEFELYTTPPKSVLKDMCQNLVEANLAPMSLVYFGSPIKQDHYLSDAVLCEISSQMAANNILVTLMPASPSTSSLVSVGGGSGGRSTTHASGTAAGSSSARTSSVPSSSTSFQSGNIPKWFPSGKK